MGKLFIKITELIGWIQIMISPMLIGVVIGFIVYYNFSYTIGLVIGCIIAILGSSIGIKLATRKFKTSGTVDFLSRIHASPDIVEKSETIEK